MPVEVDALKVGEVVITERRKWQMLTLGKYSGQPMTAEELKNTRYFIVVNQK